MTDLKSVKNETEISHLKTALLDDGAALVRFACWLEGQLEAGEPVDELACSRQVAAFRREVEGYRHEAFEAIVGYAAHGALNHYAVTEESSAALEPTGLLLIDSGGNYLHGLTDTTRVWSLGEPSAEEKADFTLVLRALIELLTTEFVEGTTGAQLDGICRAPLWAAGRQFKHGTGHGIGFGLEVHEGPQNISPRSNEKFRLGQVTTVEPGCYRPGQWGVRLENMVHTVISRETEFGRFFRFENLTFCPLDRRCVDPALLEERHLDWLDAYHAEVRQRLSSRLDETERAWLEAACRPVIR